MNHKALSDVAQIIMGQSPPSSTYNTVGKGLPFFQGKADFGDVYPTPRVYCSEPNRIAEPGDILITVRAPVGPTNLNRDRSCIGRGLSAIRVGKKLDRDYLLYFLRFYEPQLAKAGTGSTFAAISREDLETIKIPLPTLDEQRRIAAQLSRADQLRRLRRYASQLGEGYLQSVFVEMFGDPIKNEMGWKKVKLSKMGKVQTGNTPSRKQPEYYGDYIEWIKSDNILDNRLYVTESKERLSELGLQKGRSVDKPSVLITCIAGSLSHVGDVALTDREVAFNQQINAITPYPDINLLFLHSLLTMTKTYIQYNATAGMKHIITKSNLEKLTFIKPPLAEQERFAARVARYERLRSQQREAEKQTEMLFQSLLSEAFNGQG